MKSTWWCLIGVLIIVAGCRKNEVITPIKLAPADSSHITISALLQSNMVVQRDKPVTIWGQAPANLKIGITVSWNSTTFNTVADTKGNWSVSVPASPVNASPQTIKAQTSGYEPVTLSNILIGDVWVCSGQSNMVFPVNAIAPFEGVLNYQEEIAAANYPQIRMLTVTEDMKAAPVTKFSHPVSWSICSPATVGTESAVAYYFAQKLNTTLSVPVGIIVSAVNGSYCQDWTNNEAIQSDPVLASNYSGSSNFYNGMINPLINLSIKGFTWYQGENNQNDDPSLYTRLNAALINGWRAKFNQGALPFYYVQLTPFAQDYNSTNPPGGDTTLDYLAKFREGQAKIRQAATGTGMVVTMDVGEVDNHHPRAKKPVGDRLGLLALNYTYGQTVQCVGPQYASFSANQRTVTVNFVPGTANGLSTIGNAPLTQHFFIAGADQVFRIGKAKIVGNTVVITAPPNTPLPIKAVRYAFTSAPITNLQNSDGLPAEPFRTDSWFL